MIALPRPSVVFVTRVCLAALVANMAIVFTGAMVRLTGSGLGCPTWPRCTDTSYVNTAEYGVHGVIEFGNRTLTFVLSIIVAACIVATLLERRRRRRLVLLSFSLFAGIVGQAVLGGITVRTHLNPWTVAGHFLLSMVLIAVAATLVAAARESAPPSGSVTRAMRRLGLAVTAVTALVLVLGTVVTGSGPHAGDSSAARTGFDPVTVSRLHGTAVIVLVLLTVALVGGLARSHDTPGRVRQAAIALLGLEIAQGAVGYLQYATGIPVALVAVHVVGACLVWLAALTLALRLRIRATAPGARPPINAQPINAEPINAEPINAEPAAPGTA